MGAATLIKPPVRERRVDANRQPLGWSRETESTAPPRLPPIIPVNQLSTDEASTRQQSDVPHEDPPLAEPPWTGPPEYEVAVLVVLRSIYARYESGDEFHACNEILRFFNGALATEKFELCREALRQLDPRRVSPTIMMAALCMTEGLGHMAHQRLAFYKNAFRVLEQSVGTEEAEYLLARYQ